MRMSWFLWIGRNQDLVRITALLFRHWSSNLTSDLSETKLRSWRGSSYGSISQFCFWRGVPSRTRVVPWKPIQGFIRNGSHHILYWIPGWECSNFSYSRVKIRSRNIICPPPARAAISSSSAISKCQVMCGFLTTAWPKLEKLLDRSLMDAKDSSIPLVDQFHWVME